MNVELKAPLSIPEGLDAMAMKTFNECPHHKLLNNLKFLYIKQDCVFLL